MVLHLILFANSFLSNIQLFRMSSSIAEHWKVCNRSVLGCGWTRWIGLSEPDNSTVRSWNWQVWPWRCLCCTRNKNCVLSGWHNAWFLFCVGEGKASSTSRRCEQSRFDILLNVSHWLLLRKRNMMHCRAFYIKCIAAVYWCMMAITPALWPWGMCDNHRTCTMALRYLLWS